MPYAHVERTPEARYLLIVNLDRPDEKFTSVIEIDSDAGWLRRITLDAAGKPVINPDNKNEMVVERVEGRFRIDIKRPGETEYHEWKPAGTFRAVVIL
jgi:hypothetical protein